MLRLLPVTEDFFAHFENEANNAGKAVALLRRLLSDFSNIEEKVKQIKEIEHEGDRLTHQTIETLNKTFVTQLDREDIHALVSKLDDILDFVDAAANRMFLYKITEPTEEVKKLADILARSVEEITRAIPLLRNLRKPKEIIQRCIEINSLENEGDQVHREGVAKLFDEVKDPITIIKWKEIYENLETAIDRCEDVANILEGIVLKYS